MSPVDPAVPCIRTVPLKLSSGLTVNVSTPDPAVGEPPIVTPLASLTIDRACASTPGPSADWLTYFAMPSTPPFCRYDATARSTAAAVAPSPVFPQVLRM